MAKKSSVTPIRQQYLDIKREHADAIVFFRLGDFYETFDNDAETISRELDIVLTGRNIGKGQRVPMAGVPHHARDNYLSRLIAKGYHVAICEQVGSTPINGLVPRKVVRVVTPGTVVEPNMLDANRNNYLAACVVDGNRAGVAHVDITTGQFATTQIEDQRCLQMALQELTRLSPTEVVLPEDIAEHMNALDSYQSKVNPWKANESTARQVLEAHFDVATLAGFGVESKPLALRAAGLIIQYLREHQQEALTLLTSLSLYVMGDFMQLDAATRRNLELTETLRGSQKQGSLLGALDRTVTPMGGRYLRQWVSEPLLDVSAVNQRLEGVESFFNDAVLRASMRDALKVMGDLERLINRVRGGSASPRDLGSIRDTLQQLPVVTALGTELPKGVLKQTIEKLDSANDMIDLVGRALVDEPPTKLDKPGVIRAGWSEELDGIMAASKGARDWIANLEPQEKAATGISNLKVGFNKVFGYYIEISKSNTKFAPEHYIRKQTLVNAERYITPELKEYETLVLNAEEQILAVEKRLFEELCVQLAAQAERLLHNARLLARLDVFASLAEAAAINNYVKPKVVQEDVLQLINCRHPVVERSLPPGQRFTPNDCEYTMGERIWVITGPNMSGKSTFLRQIAICVLMAQIGSFVPADAATIGIVDRIFSRIGAQDEIHAGQSTFMVEMVETANILNNATNRSLLILDEIGRGTSTYDGLSLAWAIIEYVHNHPRLKAKTLFATHYHELIDLSNMLPGVSNYNVAVSEEGDDVVFLHRIVAGGADKSYGIHVAKLAGLPKPLIQRAEEILDKLETSGGSATPPPAEVFERPQQMALFPQTNPLLDELGALDVNTLTPLDALTKLYEWQKKFGS